MTYGISAEVFKPSDTKKMTTSQAQSPVHVQTSLHIGFLKVTIISLTCSILVNPIHLQRKNNLLLVQVV